MKILVIFCLVSLTAAFKYSDDDRLKFSKECAKSTNAKPADLREFRKFNFREDNDTIKDYVLCCWKKLGALNDDETLNEEKVKKLLDGTEEEAAQIVKRCLVEAVTPQEAAYRALACIYNSGPANRLKQIRRD